MALATNYLQRSRLVPKPAWDRRDTRWDALLRQVEQDHNRRQASGCSAEVQVRCLYRDLREIFDKEEEATQPPPSPITRKKEPRSKWLEFKVWALALLSGDTPFHIYWEMKHGSG